MTEHPSSGAGPGTRVAERYRLQERISDHHGCTLWKAVDEALARPVAVRTFGSGFPHGARVVAAARAAGRVGDSRLAQVFDADENAPRPYLVCEWVGGERLTDLLARGPLEADRAVEFLREAAAALAAAHAAGVTHQRLDPSCLVWARGGAVRITGLGVEAALHGSDPTVSGPGADARALGALLYAALTGYWPERGEVGLPPAPQSAGGTAQPAGELRPGLPSAVDDMIARARGRAQGRGQDSATAALDTPDAVRDALARLPRAGPAPSAPHQAPGASGDARRAGPATPVSSPGRKLPRDTSAPATTPGPEGSGRPHLRNVLFGVAGAVVLAAIAFGLFHTVQSLDALTGSGPTGQTRPTAPGNESPDSVTALPVRSIEDRDPFADRVANPDEVGKALDGNPRTSWSTQTYTTADFGNLKPGLGLMLDMGRRVSLADVRVQLGGQGASTALELYAGKQAEKSAMRQVASASGASGRVALDPERSVRARYLLVWLTKLPPSSGGYQADIAEIAVRGG